MITVYYKGQMLSLLLLRCCRSSQLVTSLLFLEAAAPGHDRTVMRKTRGKGVARWSDLRWSSVDSNSSDIYLVTVSTDPVTIITRWFIWELPCRLCPVSQDNIPYNSPADCLLILDISTEGKLTTHLVPTAASSEVEKEQQNKVMSRRSRNTIYPHQMVAVTSHFLIMAGWWFMSQTMIGPEDSGLHRYPRYQDWLVIHNWSHWEVHHRPSEGSLWPAGPLTGH